MAAVRGGRIAMVYQDPMSSLNPVRSVGRQIVEAIRAHEDVSKDVARARAIELLGDVGIAAPARRFDSYPHQLSGGMRQRVMIAMAISASPDVLIADEPTTALDVTTQARIVDLLGRLVDEREMGVILITHDLGLAATICDTIHVMYAGRIVERSPAAQLFARPGASLQRGAARRDLPPRRGRRPADRRDRRAAAPPAAAPVRAAPSTRAARTRSTSATTETPPLHELPDDRQARCHLAEQRAGLVAA